MDEQLQKHLEHASGYLDLKMYEDALREADAVLARVPQQHEATAIKAAVYWHRHQLREAEPYVAFLAEHNPKEAGIWTQSLDAAVQTLKRALEANPADALAHFNMACYRAVQERVPEAIALLQNAFDLDPQLKPLARQEEDFETIRNLPEFQDLL